MFQDLYTKAEYFCKKFASKMSESSFLILHVFHVEKLIVNTVKIFYRYGLNLSAQQNAERKNKDTLFVNFRPVAFIMQKVWHRTLLIYHCLVKATGQKCKSVFIECRLSLWENGNWSMLYLYKFLNRHSNNEDMNINMTCFSINCLYNIFSLFQITIMIKVACTSGQKCS